LALVKLQGTGHATCDTDNNSFTYLIGNKHLLNCGHFFCTCPPLCDPVVLMSLHALGLLSAQPTVLKAPTRIEIITVRGQSYVCVFQNIAPPPPLRPASVYPPPMHAQIQYMDEIGTKTMLRCKNFNYQ
jgi:hypothetical protein